MRTNKHNTLEELVDALRGEKPRWEIELIAERVREKIVEENKLRDFDRLSDEYNRLAEMYSKMQRSLIVWQGAAIALLTSLLGIIVSLMLK